LLVFKPLDMTLEALAWQEQVLGGINGSTGPPPASPNPGGTAAAAIRSPRLTGPRGTVLSLTGSPDQA
jgi:hypothetical protein